MNATKTENMSETPIMDEVARDCQYLSGPSNLWRHQDACAFLEKGKKLERELIAAQQTIAQKDGELRALREALQQTGICHCESGFECQKCKALARFNAEKGGQG